MVFLATHHHHNGRYAVSLSRKNLLVATTDTPPQTVGYLFLSDRFPACLSVETIFAMMRVVGIRYQGSVGMRRLESFIDFHPGVKTSAKQKPTALPDRRNTCPNTSYRSLVPIFDFARL